MGKRVIAESVENKEILDRLVELGVDFAQGYYFGKPVMLSELKLPQSGITSALTWNLSLQTSLGLQTEPKQMFELTTK